MLDLKREESSETKPSGPEEIRPEQTANSAQEQVSIIEDEDRSRGKVSWDVYKIYFKYFGGVVAIGIALVAMAGW